MEPDRSTRRQTDVEGRCHAGHAQVGRIGVSAGPGLDDRVERGVDVDVAARPG